MSTVDLTKVAGFKAVDAEGNDMGVVSLSEITNMVKESIVQEAVAMQSVSTLAETSTLAATDTYEDQLPTSDTFSYVRTLDASGNPKRTSQNALATVVGGLLGMDYINLIRMSSVNIPSSKSYYKIVDSSVRKCVYRVIYVEDRYAPNILYLSIYDKNYKSDYKINRVVNGGSTTTFKFLYDDLGSIYFCKEDGTRGGVLSLQLLSGDTQAKIENVNSADGTEIPIL